MLSFPIAQALQHGSQCRAILRNRIVHTRRYGAGVVADQNAGVDKFVQVANQHALALMPFWYIGTLVVLIAGAVLSRNVLAIAAVALMGAALLLTVTVLVPINNWIGAWQSNDDVNRDLAIRWDRLHWVWMGMLVAMFIALAVGVVG